MKGLRQLIVNALRSVMLRSGRIAKLIHARPGVRVLMHHGVGVPQHPLAEFEEQIAWLKQQFEILPMEEVVSRLRADQPLPSCAVVLTFDDGLRNNGNHAAPILVRHQCPAVFFVCPGLIDRGEWLWTSEMRCRTAKMDASQLPGHDTTKSVVDWMKALAHDERAKIITKIRELTPGWTPGSSDREAHELMTWSELEKLDRQCISIGSHTVSHPMLSHLDASAIDSELNESLVALRAHGFADEKPLICYPNGDHDQRVLDAARRHYFGGCGTMKGLVKSGVSPFCLPRIGASAPLKDVAWRMWRPGS